MFAGNFAPEFWAFCHGQALTISEYDSLFQLIGTTYGGDGETTFNLPDLRGRAPIHMGQGPGLSGYTLGDFGGSESITLTANQIPAHIHSHAAVKPAANTSPVNNLVANTGATLIYADGEGASQASPMAAASAGGNQPHDNMMPFLCVSFIISLFGVFPPPAN
jgi:microcystin-dependent protein